MAFKYVSLVFLNRQRQYIDWGEGVVQLLYLRKIAFVNPLISVETQPPLCFAPINR